jgi:CDGSH-type Zn-finger protein/uncharacterized Fe-S cluster protein YjdI
MTPPESVSAPSRELLIHQLHEAAELEHCLMCTYLYAAFSLKSGTAEGLSEEEAAAVDRWRRSILQVAIEEMSHLAAVWNITAALGGAPRFGRANFPLSPGLLPAGMVVKLSPFTEAALQHFIHLERPEGSTEAEGAGFEAKYVFKRAVESARLTPMGLDYETVGAFYAALNAGLEAFTREHGEAAAFCGDAALQLSSAEIELSGARPVICLKTARAAFTSIVEQGEGAPEHSEDSHFQKFVAIRGELRALKAKNPGFAPAWPAAENPVLRPPLEREGRVWIEHEEAAKAVDLANTGYGLMLRLLAYTYSVPRPHPHKALAVELSLGLMRAVTLFAERAARLPAGPSHASINAGMSFTALRDAAALPTGASAARFFVERLTQMAGAAETMAQGGDARMTRAARILADLAQQTQTQFVPQPAPTTVPAPPGPLPPESLRPPVSPPATVSTAPAPLTPASPSPPSKIPVPTLIGNTEHIDGKHLTLLFEAKKCIHARFCVTWGPQVFIANVQGPWIDPDAADVERLVEIAHACPSGAIRYQRKDGKPEEAPPPVNLVAVREAGPYAVRADIHMNGSSKNYRATLCRCGASKNKPFCDGSHHEAGFNASGEPATGKADMLPVRNGPLSIEPERDGPLRVRGNLEITSGTGRVVARLTQARLCRCGGSSNKPFCDGTHARIGFQS